MTRIIGGSAGGRRLTTPRGQNTRPTSDRVREALFSAIESWCGSLDGLRFLDLYAGSGAIGLEARSRGAGVVTMVESDRRTAQLVNTNIRSLNFNHVEVISTTVAATLQRTPVAPYDVAFLDPPYPLENHAVEGDLALLLRNDWLAKDALVVVERGARGAGFTWPDGLTGWREKKYGETVLRYGHAASPAATEE
ncbi:MAG TPA: 16S rRNA (guanine(966)-N(2))-methyltransferase RsmD [Nocardioides sp.]